MSAPWPLDEQLCFALYAANMAMQRTYKPMLDELGLTYPQYLAMLVLWEEDGRTIGAIAQRLGLESSTVTPLVKRLEASGMVARERDPQDERQVRVRLTPGGLALRDQCGCLGEEITARSGMSVERLIGFREDMRALRRELERSEEHGGRATIAGSAD
ncbi:MarR family winged helix-turn-helix transcriptional regulator [Sphingomonas sanguinis]|jgi:DNA-binding MarR family transcriptional regulator|uniref:MarR family transcriptional regulator n=1 Tax=Sphingomonas sanguinis TaxID=33051 RepID=A0A7Y7UNT3_9SPHN|nr:MarR family transcriptional regulator [Sphingomonas sanguinis]MBZ6380219.1 MarR family transcriptional regulator [Sphingomonas sanguinis]NNG48849.1 MarR family transcriptional regulator [Sphingomonas sanguinis]NNG52098.1 MarR family transcriptional regulator [Sphingomonas sanguinis]NVP29522.1 MarR family transcriptional regulator [Sphingomonas sanguinis]